MYANAKRFQSLPKITSLASNQWHIDYSSRMQVLVFKLEMYVAWRGDIE
jgi:hypothetical protein